MTTRNYRHVMVREASVEELVMEIFQRLKTETAPKKTKRYGKHYMTTIGIGKNHTADLCIDAEAFKKLNEIVSQTSDFPYLIDPDNWKVVHGHG